MNTNLLQTIHNVHFYYEAKRRGINIEEVQYVGAYFFLKLF